MRRQGIKFGQRGGQIACGKGGLGARQHGIGVGPLPRGQRPRAGLAAQKGPDTLGPAFTHVGLQGGVKRHAGGIGKAGTQGLQGGQAGLGVVGQDDGQVLTRHVSHGSAVGGTRIESGQNLAQGGATGGSVSNRLGIGFDGGDAGGCLGQFGVDGGSGGGGQAAGFQRVNLGPQLGQVGGGGGGRDGGDPGLQRVNAGGLVGCGLGGVGLRGCGLKRGHAGG